MLVKKIGVCAALFIAILVCGGILNAHLESKRQKSIILSMPSPAFYTIFSTPFLENKNPLFYRYQPREYIRIVKRFKH